MKKALIGAAMTFAVLGSSAYGQEDKVRFVLSGTSFAFMPYFVADSAGFLEQNGIDAELIRANSGSAIVATLVGGGADVAIVGANEVLTARRAGVDLVLLGIAVRQVASALSFSKEWAEKHGITEASPIEDKFDALNGIRIATTGHGSAYDLVHYLAKLEGLELDRDIIMVPLGTDPGAYQAAIEQGRVDGFVYSAPNPQRLRRELGAVIAFNNARGEVKQLDGYPYITVTSTRNWAEENPSAVEKIENAFVDALTAISDPARTEGVRDTVHAAHFSEIDKAIFDEAWVDYVAGNSTEFTATQADIERVADFLNEISSEKIDVKEWGSIIFSR